MYTLGELIKNSKEIKHETGIQYLSEFFYEVTDVFYMISVKFRSVALKKALLKHFPHPINDSWKLYSTYFI